MGLAFRPPATWKCDRARLNFSPAQPRRAGGRQEPLPARPQGDKKRRRKHALQHQEISIGPYLGLWPRVRPHTLAPFCGLTSSQHHHVVKTCILIHEHEASLTVSSLIVSPLTSTLLSLSPFVQLHFAGFFDHRRFHLPAASFCRASLRQGSSGSG